MNRRDLLTAIAGSAAGVSVLGKSVLADEPTPALPDIYRITPNGEANLDAQSTEVVDGDSKFNIIRLGICRLKLDDHGHLTASVKAAVTQYAKVDYWISLAVFDEEGRFLGSAAHKEAIEYIRFGAIPTLLPELSFDFGISKAYKSIACLAVAISDRDVPKPGPR